MKYTNKLDLPDAICEAVKNDGYSQGDAEYSVTGLLRPPRQLALEKLHAEEVTEDISDRIWSLMGQSIHTILERANKIGIAERRLSTEVNGVKISGGMDLFDENGILTDYKVTSVWKVIKGDLEEWEKQLNLYSVLLRHHGHRVEKLQVVAILRDWSKMEAQRDAAYPQAQVVNIEIRLWPPGKAEAFLKQRVLMHQAAKTELPFCSAEDRWQRADVYAVMKTGRKSAVRLYDNSHDAASHAAREAGASVVKRPGASIRCESYCAVAQFCSQFQKSKTVKEEVAS